MEIDGSLGEGGGQVLRGAVSFSCITGKSVNVFNIRGNRPKPGLQPQHLVSVEAAARISDAETEGLELGSREISFRPKSIRGGRHVFDIKTAGSATLVIQTLLPALIFAKEESEVKVLGGTDVPWSPPVDYMKQVMLPALQSMGVDASISMTRRGHYPRGGGEITLAVSPAKFLSPVRAVERGPIGAVRGISHCTNLPNNVAIRQATSAEKLLKKLGELNLRISNEVTQTPGGGPGSGITIWAEVGGGRRVGADALGAREKSAEQVGGEAVEKLIQELQTGMAFDSHLGDMIIPYIAMANGISEVGLSCLTQHSETMIWISKIFLTVDWQVAGERGNPGVVRVCGAGLKNMRGQTP